MLNQLIDGRWVDFNAMDWYNMNPDDYQFGKPNRYWMYRALAENSTPFKLRYDIAKFFGHINGTKLLRNLNWMRIGARIQMWINRARKQVLDNKWAPGGSEYGKTLRSFMTTAQSYSLLGKRKR
jgi:hypothetical protein